MFRKEINQSGGIMKRIVSLLLTLVVIFTMAVPVFAVDATTSATTWTEPTTTPTTPKPTTTTPAVTTTAPVAPTPAPVTVEVMKKLYLGASMVPNYRFRTGTNDNLNVTTASVVFDAAGKIVDLEWDVLEITPTMFQWQPTTLTATEKVAKNDAILAWETKREEGYAYDMTHAISKGKADNLTGKEWFEQLDFYEEFFKGMTVTEVALWFNKYCDANGRPYKLAYPEKMTDADKAVVATFTEAEKEMLVDVTTSATMSLQDSHSYFIKALLKTWAVRAEIK